MSSKNKIPNLDFDTTNITLHQNIKQDIIAISEDKLRLILKDYEDDLKINRDWQLPLGLAFSTLATLLTTNFRAFLSIEGPFWKAVFFLTFIVSFGWFLVRIYKKLRKRKMTVDDIVKRAKSIKDENPTKQEQ